MPIYNIGRDSRSEYYQSRRNHFTARLYCLYHSSWLGRAYAYLQDGFPSATMPHSEVQNMRCDRLYFKKTNAVQVEEEVS